MSKGQPPAGITPEDWSATPTNVQTLVRQLLAVVEEVQQTVPQLQEQLLKQQKRIAELEERLGKNSQNSSKPPSSDPPNVKKPPPKQKGKRKRGGQKGHPGAGRRMRPSEEVSRFVVSKPTECDACGALLLGIDPEPKRHQVCELPEIKPELVEYQRHTLQCIGCGHQTGAEWPSQMPRGRFGYRTQAVMSYLSGRFTISRRDVEEMMETIFNVDISLGAVSAQEATVSTALAEPVADAQSYVQQQPSLNTDETSWKHNHKRCWLWTADTELVTIYHIAATRGADGFKALLGTTNFGGVVTSDRWSAYNWLDPTRRQLCWAHLLRDFQAMVDRKEGSTTIGRSLLRQSDSMFALWHRIRDGTLTRHDFQQQMLPIQLQIEALLQSGTQINHSKTAACCANLLKLKSALWAFVRHDGIEPTNNAAERALRRAVLWRKRSFGSQSERGLRFTERILTVVSSLRKQQRNVLDFLVLACQNHHLGLPPPSLLPAAAPS